MNTKLLILAAVATMGLAAQGAGRNLAADIPFAFEVNGKKMAAGKYDLLPTGKQAYITIRHARTGHGFFVIPPGSAGTRLLGNQLVFKAYADSYVLTEITDRATGGVIRVPQSRAAREMAKVIPGVTVIKNAE